MSGDDAILNCRNVAVQFGGVVALNDLSLSVKRGEILGIAGPNGAGKTTLFNVISGHVSPQQGDITFNGEILANEPPHKIFQRGIARTFQHPELITSQTIFTNVLVGAHFSQDTAWLGSLKFTREILEATEQALERFGLTTVQNKVIGHASLYEKKLTMLASAVAHAPSVLLLDEPMSGLNVAAADSVLKQVRRLRETGTTIVIVEHVMRLLASISDRFAILHQGQLLFEGTPEDARRNPEVQRIYLGRKGARDG